MRYLVLIHKDIWWAKQGEEPLDLLLVRQNYSFYTLLHCGLFYVATYVLPLAEQIIKLSACLHPASAVSRASRFRSLFFIKPYIPHCRCRNSEGHDSIFLISEEIYTISAERKGIDLSYAQWHFTPFLMLQDKCRILKSNGVVGIEFFAVVHSLVFS